MSINPNRLDYAALARGLMAGVLEAGRIEMRHYEAGVETEYKGDQSPVTAADREAEDVLVDAIASAAPGTPIVAEEAASQGRVPRAARTFFLVDPLDGTKEFINKRGEFTVNIALVSDGVPVFGIVYAPAMGDLYVTLGKDKAVAAKVELAAARYDDCAFQPIAVRAPYLGGLTAVASRSHMSAEGEAWLSKWKIMFRRDAGSSLKFCSIARGEADLYPRHGPTMEWDTAAGDAVLRAAGGVVTTLDGKPLRYGKAAEGYRNPYFIAWGAPEPFAQKP